MEKSSLFKTMAVYEPCSCVSDINKRAEQAKEGEGGGGTFYPKNVLFPQILPTEVIIIGIVQTSCVA